MNDQIGKFRKAFADEWHMNAWQWFTAVLNFAEYDSPIEEMFAAALILMRHSTFAGSKLVDEFPEVHVAFGAESYSHAFVESSIENNNRGVFGISGLVVLLHPKIKIDSGVITPDFGFGYVPGKFLQKLGEENDSFSFATKIAVELDGHEFHERTKDQATRDKSRDRALLKRGWSTMRFTGSEVFKDALRCACECASLVYQKEYPNTSYDPYETDRFMP